jgi:hypothetical protein
MELKKAKSAITPQTIDSPQAHAPFIKSVK